MIDSRKQKKRLPPTFGNPVSRLRFAWASVLALLIATPLFVFYLTPLIQSGSLTLLLIPPAIAGLLLGTRVGILVGLVTTFISIQFTHVFEKPLTETLIVAGLSSLGCIFVAFIFGKISSLSEQWKTEQRQRLQAEKRLWESRERYRALFQHAADSVLIIDPKSVENATIVEVNETACKTHGYSREEFIGIPLGTVVAKLDPSILAGRIQRILDGELLSVETHHARKDGSVFPVEVTACRIDVGNKPLIQAIDRDITSRKQAQEEKERLATRIQQSQKMEAIGQLAGGVAHDINNILAVIMGAASSTQGDFDRGSTHAEVFNDILAACRQGRDLTTNLLGFAREGTYVREQVSVHELIRETVALLKRTAPKGIEIKLLIEDEPIFVNADRSQIGQVLMNIYLNAIDAMGERGTLTIESRKKTLDANTIPDQVNLPSGEYVQLKITDTGCGIDEEIISRVFEPFFTTKPLGKGTGLGLAMVYGTIENHNGNIQITNEIGQGTTLVITLPTQPRTSKSDRKPISVIPTPHRGEDAILLVDDEALIRRMATRLLSKLGYSNFIAGGGAEALEIYRREQKKISLIILDLAMPEMDGEATFKQLVEFDPEVQVLISSGYAKDNKIEELLDGGAVGFIQKPFTLKELSRKLRGLRPSSD